MIILIGGETHSGKTLMAQRMMERLMIPYTSLDHIKMGLIRGDIDCGFSISDGDEYISQRMWGVVKGIIDTCEENSQHIILEGCYLPPEKVKAILNEDVCAVYLILSESYIRKHSDMILQCESVIEKRLFDGDFDVSGLITHNKCLLDRCVGAGVKYFVIDNDYDKDILAAYRYAEDFASRRRAAYASL